MKVLSIKLPPDLDRRVREVARRRQVPVATVVRESLAEYVARDAPARAGSFLEAAGGLIGSVHEAPADLASNPAHLAGYGASRPATRRRRRR